MSEFPDWLEERLGLGGLSYERAQELHRAIEVLSRYVPDLDERLTLPTRHKKPSVWKRLWSPYD